MADFKSYVLVDVNNAPLTTATPTFTDYRSRAGTALSPQPPIVHLGNGVYGFMPTDDDEVGGVAFLIDNGAGSFPRRVSGAVHKSQAPFVAWHAEDGVGALYAGVSSPTFGLYDDPSGSPRTPPTIVAVKSPYLWAFTPSSSDYASDVGFRVDNPAGSFPSYIGGSIDLPLSSDIAAGASLVELIRAQLLGDPTVTGLVSTRIYPQVMPQNAAKPAVVLSEIYNIPLNSFGGTVSSRLQASRLQVDCYASRYLTAHTVARAVEAVVGDLTSISLSAVRENLEDIYEDATQLHRVSMDFTVWR